MEPHQIPSDPNATLDDYSPGTAAKFATLKDRESRRDERAHAASEAMIDGPREIAGYVLRPFAFGSTRLARKMGLTMFYDRNAKLSDEDTMDQLAAFFWMQSEDVDVVLKAVNSGTWPDIVERFSLTLPLHHVGEMLAEVNRISELAIAAAVDVEPRPGSSDSDAPGN